MKTIRLVRLFTSVAALLLWSFGAAAAPLGTAFTYQGRLTDAGGDANGNYDMRFALYSTSVGGSPIVTITNLNVAVSNGLFTTTLDFGTGVFTGDAYWLELAVRTNGSGEFTALSPRQELTPSPYALYAAAAPLADGSVTSAKILDGTIANADLDAGAVTTDKISDGTITGADLADNTVTSAQLADSIDLGSPAVNGTLNIYRTLAGTPALSLIGSGSRLSVYGSSDGFERVRLYGPSWGELMLFDNVGNDLTVDLRANNDGGGSLYLYHSNNSARAYLWASSVAGDLQLSTTNGTARARLHGGTDGSYLNLYTADGNGALYLDGDDGGAGSIAVRNTNGADRVFIDGLGNSGGGQITVYTGDGQYGVILYGDVSGGAQMYLYNTNNSVRLWLDGYGSSGGGQVLLYANNGSQTINLHGDSGGGGLIEVKNTNSLTRAILDGQGSYGGGDLYLYDADGSTTVLLQAAYGSSLGAWLRLSQADGSTGVEIFAENYANDGGLISLKNAGGLERLELDGDDGDGAAAIRLRNTNGVTTITLDASVAGNGRITTQELQITGGSDLSEQFDVHAADQPVEPGMVVCIDPTNPGQLVLSSTPYDRTVAGVISGAGGVKPGMLMSQQGTLADGKYAVALTGRVYCLADASYGAIQPGDLLTTSSTAGHAMKVQDHTRAQGAVLGKAMSALSSGRGLVLVLVSLQ